MRNKARNSKVAVDVELYGFLTLILGIKTWREALSGCIVPGEETRSTFWVRV